MAGKGGKRSTSWKPGQSGNALGTRKGVKDVKELARKYTVDSIETLHDIMMNPDSPPSARVAAANSLLDRGHGKVPQPITGEGGEGAVKVKVSLSGKSAN